MCFRILFSSVGFLCIFAGCAGCQEETVPEERPRKAARRPAVSFMDTTFLPAKTAGRREGILIGQPLQLRNPKFEMLKDFRNLENHFIVINGITTSRYKEKPTDDNCAAFPYVATEIAGVSGYIDGRRVYELQPVEPDNHARFGESEVTFQAALYFGTGVSDSNGLTGCETHSPVVFTDSETGYKGLLEMVPNKYHHYQRPFPYFQLLQDDQGYDQIVGIQKTGSGRYLLTIQRSLQEGSARLLVAVYKNAAGHFVAEIKEEVFREE